MTAVAIMQPTYLPWIGYFALIDRVDVFVFLDSVQFDRRSWQQRNRIKGAGGPQMLTVPVFKKGLREQCIADVRINPAAGFPGKHVRAIEHCYAHAPRFEPYGAGLIDILRRPHKRLANLTIDLIQWLAGQLGITTRWVLSSSLDATGKKADLLVDLCRKLGADRYVSPPGARAYLENSDAFDSLGIPVIYNDYRHPAYPQLHGPFVSHLSIVDLMFNVGPDSIAVIRKGVV